MDTFIRTYILTCDIDCKRSCFFQSWWWQVWCCYWWFK